MINTANVPYAMTEAAKATYEALKALPVPEIVQSTNTAEQLAGIAAEDACKFLPSIISNQYELGNMIANTGAVVKECAFEIGKVSAKAGIALGLGLIAVGGGYLLWRKYKAQEQRIDELNKRVEGLV